MRSPIRKCALPITIGVFGASGFHPFRELCKCHTQPACKKVEPTHRKGEPPSLDTEEQEKRRRRLEDSWKTQARACVCIKIEQNMRSPVFTSWHNWGSDLQALCFPSFPHPEHLHLQYFNMSRASILAGAHHFVARENMFINTNTVSRM